MIIWLRKTWATFCHLHQYGRLITWAKKKTTFFRIMRVRTYATAYTWPEVTITQTQQIWLKGISVNNPVIRHGLGQTFPPAVIWFFSSRGVQIARSSRTRPRIQGLLLLPVIAEYRERTNYRIPVHYCILEAAFFEERGISIHMQVSGRVFWNLARRNIWGILLKFTYRRGDKIDLWWHRYYR